MALQRKRKRPSYELQSIDDDSVLEQPSKRMRGSNGSDARISLEVVGSTSSRALCNTVVDESVGQQIIKQLIQDWTLDKNAEQ